MFLERLETLKGKEELSKFFKHHKNETIRYFLYVILNKKYSLDLSCHIYTSSGFFLKPLLTYKSYQEKGERAYKKAYDFLTTHPRGRALSIINALETNKANMYFYIKTNITSSELAKDYFYYLKPIKMLEKLEKGKASFKELKHIFLETHKELNNNRIYGVHCISKDIKTSLLNELKEIVKLSPRDLKTYCEALTYEEPSLFKDIA